MAFDFRGKTILVTGSGRGIGRGIALGLAKAGCKVYALDCVQESLDILASESSNIITVLQDLSNWDDTKSTLEKLEALDGLVNNAGFFAGLLPALEHTKEQLDKYMAVNLYAYINCIQVVGKKMIDAKRKGSIVNISSIASLKAAPNCLGYSVTKAGVDMVTKQFALELGPHNIRVNSVNPELVKTDIYKALAKGYDENVIERMPIARILEVDDVVGPVMYLLSDYAAMVTGTMHLVDGGESCNKSTKQ